MSIFYLVEQHTSFSLHNLQILYICILCFSTNINTIIELLPNCLQHDSGDGFNGGSDSYLPFQNTHATCLLKPSNGIVRLWLFPEFDAELPQDNYTTTIILINHLYIHTYRQTTNIIIWTFSSHRMVTTFASNIYIF